MPRISLRDYDKFRRVIWLDTESGDVATELLDRTKAEKVKRYGYAQKVNKFPLGSFWAAVYQNQDGVIFQLHAKKWRLYDPNVIMHRTSFAEVLGRIRIIQHGKTRYVATYFAGASNPVNLLDSTWGLEEYDLLKWITLSARDLTWVQSQHWRDGFCG